VESATLITPPSALTDGEKRGGPQLRRCCGRTPEEDGGGGLLQLRARGRACVHHDAKQTERGTGAEPLVIGKGQACYRTLNRRHKVLDNYRSEMQSTVPRSLQKVYCTLLRHLLSVFVVP
jgi:hypothetical protein